ncbi:hypothetical protein CHUAL_000174 [Chamberlinius hualienensis]
MSGYYFIIVLVTLSTLQLNTIIRASKYTTPYIPYDNACTRITPAASADQENNYISHENPAKPGQMEDYYGCLNPWFHCDISLKPAIVSVIVAYHKDIGYGVIECPAKNGSEVSDVFVFGNFISFIREQPRKKMIEIKEEVMKIANVNDVRINSIPSLACWSWKDNYLIFITKSKTIVILENKAIEEIKKGVGAAPEQGAMEQQNG